MPLSELDADLYFGAVWRLRAFVEASKFECEFGRGVAELVGCVGELGLHEVTA